MKLKAKPFFSKPGVEGASNARAGVRQPFTHGERGPNQFPGEKWCMNCWQFSLTSQKSIDAQEVSVAQNLFWQHVTFLRRIDKNEAILYLKYSEVYHQIPLQLLVLCTVRPLMLFLQLENFFGGGGVVRVRKLLRGLLQFCRTVVATMYSSSKITDNVGAQGE